MMNYKEIREPENDLDEIDVIGFLLEKYVQESVYCKDDKTWSVPNKVLASIQKEH